MAFHLICFATILLTRKYINMQIIIFCALSKLTFTENSKVVFVILWWIVAIVTFCFHNRYWFKVMLQDAYDNNHNKDYGDII